MKKIAVLSLLIATGFANAEVTFVPLDMALGYWETTTHVEESQMMKDLLANMPEEQRAMVSEMMKRKMEMAVSNQCITEESFKDMESQIKRSLSAAVNDCGLQVTKSTPQEFKGVFVCEGSGPIIISTKAIHSKRNEAQLNAEMSELGLNNIKTISEWKSATCPEGVE